MGPRSSSSSVVTIRPSMPNHEPRHVTAFARLASVVWLAFFMTIAFGVHWGVDSVVLLAASLLATGLAIWVQGALEVARRGMRARTRRWGPTVEGL